MIQVHFFTLFLLSFLSVAWGFPEGAEGPRADNTMDLGHTSSTIITNAKSWLNPCVAYSQSSYHAGPDGKTYRQDCSGYVSMSWALGTSATTSTLASYATKITKADLASGDILLYAGSHTLIFDKWTDSSKTNYWTYEQHPSCTEYHSIPYPYWSGYSPEKYIPYRYNKVTVAVTSSNSTA